jgi:hypothetical protein
VLHARAYLQDASRHHHQILLLWAMRQQHEWKTTNQKIQVRTLKLGYSACFSSSSCDTLVSAFSWPSSASQAVRVRAGELKQTTATKHKVQEQRTVWCCPNAGAQQALCELIYDISSLLRVKSARIILEGSLARLSERESESESRDRGCASTDLGAAALPREGCLLLPEANVSPGALPGVAAQPRRTFHQGVAKGKNEVQSGLIQFTVSTGLNRFNPTLANDLVPSGPSSF